MRPGSRWIRFGRSIVASASLLLLAPIGALAAPLGLNLLTSPDIASDFISVSYDASTDILLASGFAETYDTGSGVLAISGGTFDLSASVDSSGNLLGGTFTIGGTIDSLGFTSGTLLTGDLTGFGFVDGGGDPFEFLFTTTGGDAAGEYGDVGGIILSDVGFLGSFQRSFSNNGMGVADAAPIPEPSAALCFGIGAFIAGLSARKRR